MPDKCGEGRRIVGTRMTQPTDSEPVKPTPRGPYPVSASHLLTSVQTNNIRLSQLADQKASILVGATFLVFSLAVSQALGGHLTWSLGVLATFAFLSALLGVMAIMPSVRAPRAGNPDAVNRLFFGHYAGLDEREWTDGLLDQLATDEGTFRLVLRDIYQNGQVLKNRKYRYLAYAYRVFLVGLIATLVTFVAEQALTGSMLR